LVAASLLTLNAAGHGVDRLLDRARPSGSQVQIAQEIESDPALRARRDTLLTAKGVGPAVAAVLVSERPELGTLRRN